MHFHEEIERIKTVAVDTVLCDQAKYPFLVSFENLFGFSSSTLFLDYLSQYFLGLNHFKSEHF
tara:strand:+ start:502 stop:690 length:189 start_codon:yes stop_codon:yes gene_type:complete